MLMLVAETMD
jgi:hypothetical protein